MVRKKATALQVVPRRDPAATAEILRASADPHATRRALEAIAADKRITPPERAALLALFSAPLDPALEHAALFAALTTRCFDLETLRTSANPAAIRRLLRVLEQTLADVTAQDALLEIARRHVEAKDATLAAAAAATVARHPRALALAGEEFNARLSAPQVAPSTLAMLTEVVGTNFTQPAALNLDIFVLSAICCPSTVLVSSDTAHTAAHSSAEEPSPDYPRVAQRSLL